MKDLFRLISDEVQLGCKELRAKRFISDGFCTSLKPLKEVVCAGQCMPIKEQNLPWWAEFTKYWAKPKFLEWRCVEAVTKLKKVQLMCENGETRTYKIRVVKSCRCKSYEHGTNMTDMKGAPARGKRDKDETKQKRKARKEQRRAERRRKRLERKKAKQARQRLGMSSRESRRHKHSGDKDSRRGKRRHSGGVDTVSDSKNRNSQLLKNNESPTV